MTRLILIAFISLLLYPLNAFAVEENRGLRGNYLALSSGVVMGQSTYSDGNTTGSGIGSGYELRFGEEVLPGFTLGFCLGGGNSNGNSDRYKSGFGGLSMEAGWRPLAPPLFFILSTGIGGGSITPLSEEEDAQESQPVAGAYYRVGAQYDIQWTQKSGGGLILSPFVRGHFIPASGSSNTSITSIVSGIELGWAFGRLGEK